ncbi:MAG: heme-binding protein [Pseudomonadota bacterium]|nr:heme-binding protein [Pseudomonadota bacterium]
MKILFYIFFCFFTLFQVEKASSEFLTIAEVNQVIGQAKGEALALGINNAVVAVSDRVGNILAVYAMDPDNIPDITITSGRGIAIGNGLEGLSLPITPLAAISKAITGAYLSSSGNAFTTRTASQIVQEHFNPGEKGQPAGPLFGVQFSQLACSDLMRSGENLGIGPRRSPLGLSADPGGLPLYKKNQVVGGVGIISDGIYGLDLNVGDYDRNTDELIAVAAQRNFEPAEDIKGYRITVEGKNFRYTDVNKRFLKGNGSVLPLNTENFISVRGYIDDGPKRGREYGSINSGIRKAEGNDFPGVNAFVLDDGLGNNRYKPRDSLVPPLEEGGLTSIEVRTIIVEALKVAFRARAQIRRPLGSHAQVTVSIVDSESNILAIARTPDAPIFGTDVSLQKARTTVFASRTSTAKELSEIDGFDLIPGVISIPSLSIYVNATKEFIGPLALEDGTAFADRSGGNLSRPFYPDGIHTKTHGPFSKPFSTWSPFNTGLQLDLVFKDIVLRLDGSLHPPSGCTDLPQSQAAPGPMPRRLANGLQIFPGSVPIYRNNNLIGGIGVSGDGIDQDDMISFLGLHNAGQLLGTGVGNAPKEIRADNLKVKGVNLRFINCPFSPFLDTSEQAVCNEK